MTTTKTVSQVETKTLINLFLGFRKEDSLDSLDRLRLALTEVMTPMISDPESLAGDTFFQLECLLYQAEVGEEILFNSAEKDRYYLSLFEDDFEEDAEATLVSLIAALNEVLTPMMQGERIGSDTFSELEYIHTLAEMELEL